MNRRRQWLAVGVAWPALACSGALHAQAPAAAPRRVGVLSPATREKAEANLKPFFDRMRELGWIEGQNITYDRAFADEHNDRLPALAAQLVARGPDLIYAPPSSAAVAAKGATSSIPIVFGSANDPVAYGLVKSLGRPGGNVTGVSSMVAELSGKRVELLHEMMPGLKRLGLLGDSGDPNTPLERQRVTEAATRRGIQVVFADMSQPADLEAGFARLMAQRPDALYLLEGALTFHQSPRIGALARDRRLPMVGGASEHSLISYSRPLGRALRRSAEMVDKILRGARPADIPVEQPTVFRLTINLGAARALGLTVPQSLLLRADRVIE